ncbi:glutaryl-CoA dehydrogenase [Kocuria sp. WRN011]|uniref:acyl-CoA dehydrogenase family protein n=1 Tax=Kocuria sp. WRN011 TaxID=2029858 RepID=UPI000BB03CDE|nr:acyl-CoA dehydrogenase family protein [Kocuria sp. WRN011]PBB07442.1 glutaryl-CoA dehydrogenase [Kocuria sp. WRN011]
MSQLYPDCDPYGIADRLSEAERAPILRLRTVLENEITPLVAEYWEKGEFPYQIAPSLYGLNLMTPDEIEGAPRSLYHGFRIFELARADASMATFYTAQAGLFRTTCRVGASPEQFAELDPKITSFETTGVFCLTEPDHGSDIAGGLATTAERQGDEWILNGAKRWIGGALTADYLAVFARDVADGQVKAFLVDREATGVTLEKIYGKTALRMMQNADITLENVRVPEAQRLQNCNSFKDVAAMLRVMRSDVAWIATGIQAGAYEAALRYVRSREQFGKSLGSFQLVQEKLARMLGNVTASLSMVSDLAEKQDRGEYRDEDSALAKMWISLHMRETVALAREVVGGNGITLPTDVARFHADAEAVYSYEGTHEINALVVGRSITGKSAFA